ncbi:MAG: peptidoglycan bridge formation glycyltransferase FemA/FemB family protein [candidate division WOR-3 bacterium]
MPEVIFIDPCEDKRWDTFVENHPFGWICHLSGWKKVLEYSFSHIKGNVLALEESNKIVAGIPIYEVRSWFTGHRFVSIPFATLSDPLITSKEQRDILLPALIKLKISKMMDYIEIRSHLSDSLEYDGHFFKTTYFKSHYINLQRNVEEIRKSFHRSCVRQRIARAEKSGVSIKRGEEEDLKEFYKLYLMTRKRLCLPPQPYKFFKSIWNTFYHDKKIDLLLAEKNQEAIAGLLLFKFKNRVSAECAGSNENYNNLSPNHLLFWEAIKIAHMEGFEIFDFGRTSPMSKSLMDFKSRWGTKEVDLPIYFFPKEKAIKSDDRENSLGYKIVQKLCRIMPYPYFQYFGQFIYRHLG